MLIFECFIFIRFIFPSTQTVSNLFIWLFFDYFGDLLYLLDMVVYKNRLLFMENGFWVKDRRKIAVQYVKYGTFKYDLLSLLPTDLLYFWLGIDYTLVRQTFMDPKENMRLILSCDFFRSAFPACARSWPSGSSSTGLMPSLPSPTSFASSRL